MKYLVLVFASVVILLGCTSTPSMENYTNDPDRMWEVRILLNVNTDSGSS